MKLNKHIIAVLLSAAGLVSCNKDLLDRSETTKVIDAEFWRNQSDIRLYANDFYTNFFVGYNSGFGVAFAPLRGYNWSDDFTSEGTQASFESTVPTTRGPLTNTTLPTTDMLTQYSGPSWNFYWVRKANVMLNRIENKAKPNLSPEEYNHWTAVAKFFRAFEYSRLVGVFGDVPYFDAEVDPLDFDTMYKARTPRTEVMDKVYDDFKFVLENMRVDDGKGYVGRYTAAALISNWMLFEGTWEHYHNVDKTRAKKFLELAVEASQYVMNSGKYSFGSDFKSLFASEDLTGNPEVIFFRAYNDAVKVTHAIGSYSNGTEGQDKASNLNLLKSFICNDGQVWQNSTTAKAGDFSLKALASSRDPRFEATFMDTVNTASKTLAYVHKFASRDALNYIGKTYPAKWASNTNTNDAPVVRLAEVVLNWIEAKQVLAENYGGAAVGQNDLDKSINAIRNRPLDADATRKGVKKTAPLLLSAIPNDPTRDGDVSPLMWEIRRERRMEFVYEGSRLNDIRRWKKLDYMNFNKPEYAAGPWINALKDLPKNNAGNNLADSYKNRLKVMKADGTIVTFNGTNASDLVGYYVVANFANRVDFKERSYMSPVGLNQVQQYVDRGYTLTQTVGW
ncbi:RagB/SusD family nutrient uptake outer membrane protein [Sphingobacterium faecium]|uniref:RagB/SusD family nutrient uptake outer membrane protein n=1 Tax=Sphingobacterium faecium TaxID=34087 RepID=UPI003DA5DEDD